jgi:hypothetical protein
VGGRKQTNQLGGDNDEWMGGIRVSYVGEPTVGDGGGMWKRCVPSGCPSHGSL